VADVVNFAYAGELELNSRNIGPVTACAREIDLETVIGICRSYLLDQVDPDNVVLHYSVAANNELAEERDSLEIVLCEAFPETAKCVFEHLKQYTILTPTIAFHAHEVEIWWIGTPVKVKDPNFQNFLEIFITSSQVFPRLFDVISGELF